MEVIDGTTVGITTGRGDDGAHLSVRLLHLDPCDQPGTVRSVREGERIGAVADLEERYPGITPHVHLELYRIQDGKTLKLDPTNIIPTGCSSPQIGWR